MANVPGERQGKCDICGEVFDDFEDCIEHVKEAHRPKLLEVTCGQCGELFAVNPKLLKDAECHCPYCGFYDGWENFPELPEDEREETPCGTCGGKVPEWED